ncbi:hypothetical protein M409DRAFT_66563 [Zasmidium cellare ATCC 36951]|uniref:Cupin type-2 domain-containing protein n=1 Tax=Zasmidium cellare ATCC 36951 TaxID=1080233 RepID=A0A6A6CKS3_ZASCE|nr:uncharacterized protein M409DRAFT_66563 [Zasmidium cellare ATCC 36951]KAF2166532.1 hypothetical protein M409DRAFT_66563 [Zasmidium cellare ATCC 36951]
MPLLTPLSIPRTKVSHLNPITYDHDRAVNAIYKRGDIYFGSQTVPPNNAWSDGTRSFMAPMSDFHLLQTESFHVTSGRGVWYLGDEVIHLNEGEDMVIPPWRAHRFENLPGSTEPLRIEYRYDRQRFAMEESFFRNALTYMDDCRRVGVVPSWFQLCVFCSKAWMVPDVVPVPWVRGVGGEYVRCVVNCVIMWVCSVVGWVVFGYRGSYREYYDPEGEGRKGM